MRLLRVAVAMTAFCALSRAAVPSGPKAGETPPNFELTDQNGNRHDLKSILGPKGALLVFFRSADW